MGLSIFEVEPPEMPPMLYDTLRQGGANPASAHTRAYEKESIPSRTGGQVVSDHNRPQVTTSDHSFFKEGNRDNALFHLANHLVKGGMPVENIRNYLRFVALHCEPPFPEKEIPIKLQSALKRANDRERNLTQEITEWVVTTSGHFLTTDVHRELQLTTRREKKTCAMILRRLSEKDTPLIERYGDRNGGYRRIESDCEPEDWKNACTDAVDLWLPLDLDKIAIIPPGGIVTPAGEPNSGKTAFLMNTAKENMHKFNVHYFSSELGPSAFHRRVGKFLDITPDQWNINFYQRADNFSDVIKKGEGNLNIIDFLEIYENFYLVSKHLADIHKNLNGAIAVVALQKAKGRDDGHGGTFTREKPVLSLALSPSKAKITKLKEWREDLENPNNKEYHFKLVDGCRFIKVRGWHTPME